VDRGLGFGEPTRTRVRYSQVDRMRLLYHVVYLEFFEWARAEWARRFWKPYKELEDAGLVLVVIEAKLRYLKPAYYDDELLLYARPYDWGRSRLEFDYRIERLGEPQPICAGHTAHCFLNLQGKPVKLPDDLRELLEQAKSKRCKLKC